MIETVSEAVSEFAVRVASRRSGPRRVDGARGTTAALRRSRPRRRPGRRHRNPAQPLATAGGRVHLARAVARARPHRPRGPDRGAPARGVARVGDGGFEGVRSRASAGPGRRPAGRRASPGRFGALPAAGRRRSGRQPDPPWSSRSARGDTATPSRCATSTTGSGRAGTPGPALRRGARRSRAFLSSTARRRAGTGSRWCRASTPFAWWGGWTPRARILGAPSLRGRCGRGCCWWSSSRTGPATRRVAAPLPSRPLAEVVMTP